MGESRPAADGRELPRHPAPPTVPLAGVRGRAGDEEDRNAHVYEADGTPAYSFHAGDAIADVEATERGSIWVSYFDEGVFGHTPLGQAGLVCLDQGGRPIFRLTGLGDPW